VTPLVVAETAERLLRNYAHDGETRKLVDNLDIFLIPSANPDGSRNIAWLPDRFPNIKLSMNIHSFGNYFMWSPGARELPPGHRHRAALIRVRRARPVPVGPAVSFTAWVPDTSRPRSPAAR
jgi:Zinc carboxypeptidase